MFLTLKRDRATGDLGSIRLNFPSYLGPEKLA